MNLICNVEYFIESSQFPELPSIFNLVTSVEFPTNHLLYFMDFAQQNSTQDAPYVYIPICYFVSNPLLFTFFLSEYNNNNRKTKLSLEKSKYQRRTKRKSFSNKVKSHHSPCFIILFHHLEVYPFVLSTCT